MVSMHQMSFCYFNILLPPFSDISSCFYSRISSDQIFSHSLSYIRRHLIHPVEIYSYYRNRLSVGTDIVKQGAPGCFYCRAKEVRFLISTEFDS